VTDNHYLSITSKFQQIFYEKPYPNLIYGAMTIYPY